MRNMFFVSIFGCLLFVACEKDSDVTFGELSTVVREARHEVEVLVKDKLNSTDVQLDAAPAADEVLSDTAPAE